MSQWEKWAKKRDAIMDSFTDQRLFSQFGAYAAESIRRRALAGLSVSGGSFAPYSQKNKKYGTQVNLRITGKMLNSIKHMVISHPNGWVIRVYIPTGRQNIIAAVHNYGIPTGRAGSSAPRRRMPKREFWGIDMKTKNAIRNAMLIKMQRMAGGNVSIGQLELNV